MRKLIFFLKLKIRSFYYSVYLWVLFFFTPPPASILAQWRGETDQWILYKETFKKIYYVDKVRWAGVWMNARVVSQNYFREKL